MNELVGWLANSGELFKPHDSIRCDAMKQAVSISADSELVSGT